MTRKYKHENKINSDTKYNTFTRTHFSYGPKTIILEQVNKWTAQSYSLRFVKCLLTVLLCARLVYLKIEIKFGWFPFAHIRMPILDSCCCFDNVRKGSYLSAIYTLVSEIWLSLIFKKYTVVSSCWYMIRRFNIKTLYYILINK